MATETTNTQSREFDTLQEACNAAAKAALWKERLINFSNEFTEENDH